MSNDSTNAKKEQKPKRIISSFQDVRNSEYEDLIKERNNLNEKKAEFGYGEYIMGKFIRIIN